jgi:hypothetical protein
MVSHIRLKETRLHLRVGMEQYGYGIRSLAIAVRHYPVITNQSSASRMLGTMARSLLALMIAQYDCGALYQENVVALFLVTATEFGILHTHLKDISLPLPAMTGRFDSGMW